MSLPAAGGAAANVCFSLTNGSFLSEKFLKRSEFWRKTARRSEMRWIYFHRHDIIYSEIIKKNTGYMEPVIQETETKSVLTKSNLSVADFSVNPYVGCAHACKYCYAS